MKQGIFIPSSYADYRIGKKRNVIPFPNSLKLRLAFDNCEICLFKKIQQQAFHEIIT